MRRVRSAGKGIRLPAPRPPQLREAPGSQRPDSARRAQAVRQRGSRPGASFPRAKRPRGARKRWRAEDPTIEAPVNKKRHADDVNSGKRFWLAAAAIATLNARRSTRRGEAIRYRSDYAGRSACTRELLAVNAG
jgi:hypothetical protein